MVSRTALWWPARPSFDGQRLLADTQAICEAEIRFWHGAIKTIARNPANPGPGPIPYENYVFMLNAVAMAMAGWSMPIPLR